MDGDELLTDEGAAKRLGSSVTPETLRNWRYLGRGPKFLKIGKRVAYRKSDIDAWLATRVHDPEAVASS